MRSKRSHKANENGRDRYAVKYLPIHQIKPSPENEDIYGPIEANMDMELYERVCHQEEEDCEELRRIREEIASQLEF